MLASNSMFSRIVSFALLLSASANVATALDFPRQTNVLGAANVFGYLNYQVELGKVELTEDVSVPVLIDFSSDPERQPGMLGWGWRFPLLESRLYLESEKKLRWDAINGETYYLFEGKEQGVYELPGGGITAKQGRGEDAFEVIHNSGWVFDYSRGSLRRFSLSDGTLIYMREGHRRMVSSITDDRGQPLFEVRYDRATPEQLIFNHAETVDLEFTDIRWKFALQSLEGSEEEPKEIEVESDSFSNLASIRFGEAANSEIYAYAQSDVVNRPAGMPSSYLNSKMKLPKKLLPSELKVTRESAPEYVFGWDGISGHLSGAGGDSYEVIPRQSPFEYSKIKRIVQSGVIDSWDHDVKKGVKTVMDRDGLTKKTYYILSKGNLYGKVRKEEDLRGGEIVRKVINSFDPDGRLKRVVDSTGDIKAYNYHNSGTVSEIFLNGILTYYYDDSYEGGSRSWLLDGDSFIAEFFNSEGRLLERYIGDQLVFSSLYDDLGRLKEELDHTADVKKVYTYQGDAQDNQMVTVSRAEQTYEIITNMRGDLLELKSHGSQIPLFRSK